MGNVPSVPGFPSYVRASDRRLRLGRHDLHQIGVCRMRLNPSEITVFAIILIPLAAIAATAVFSPETLVRHLGGPKSQRARTRELFLRVAGILLLVGALWTWHEWWRFR
jgi:hypothetical protein